jgi:hypothetical protein
LIELLRDREKALEMGRAGAERARRRFTWSAVIERMVQALADDVDRPVSATPTDARGSGDDGAR